jgi:hypothetical protein
MSEQLYWLWQTLREYSKNKGLIQTTDKAYHAALLGRTVGFIRLRNANVAL